MNITQSQSLIISTLLDFGLAVLAILGSVLVLGLAYLVFDFGYKTIIHGRTSRISSKILFLDHVPFVKPYKGYNRLRSKRWNIEHTM